MSTIKPIYMGKCLDDLVKLIAVSETFKKKSIQQYVHNPFSVKLHRNVRLIVLALAFVPTLICHFTCALVSSRICQSAQLLNGAIAKAELEGDEEQAYVYMMKYFSLVTMLKSKFDYEREKDYIKRELGGNDGWKRRMDILQRLRDSLEQRYILSLMIFDRYVVVFL